MSKPMSEQMQKLADRYEKATGKKFGARTNADRIRSMTDEELAEFLDLIWEISAIAKQKGLEGFGDTLHWLRQPAEEVGHG